MSGILSSFSVGRKDIAVSEMQNAPYYLGICSIWFFSTVNLRDGTFLSDVVKTECFGLFK